MPRASLREKINGREIYPEIREKMKNTGTDTGENHASK